VPDPLDPHEPIQPLDQHGSAIRPEAAAVPTPDQVAEVMAVVEEPEAPTTGQVRTRRRISRVLLVLVVVSIGLLVAALMAAPHATADRRAADEQVAASQDQLDSARSDASESARKVDMTRTEVAAYGDDAAIAAATLHELDGPSAESDDLAGQIIDHGRSGRWVGFNALVDRANTLEGQVNDILDRLTPQVPVSSPTLER